MLRNFGTFLPLEYAARQGDEQLVRQLLKDKADINQTGGYNTPLTAASFSGHVHVIEILCKHKADLSKCNPVGYFPLQAAARYGRNEAVKSLIQLRCNIEQKNKNGFTALFYAVTEKKSEVVETLLNNGASVHTKNNFEGTPLTAARGDIANIIKSHLEKIRNSKENADPLESKTNINFIEKFNLLADLITKQYAQAPKVKLGLFSGKPERPVREMADIINHIKTEDIGLKSGLAQLLDLAKKSGNYAVRDAVSRCDGIVSKHDSYRELMCIRSTLKT